MFSYHRLDVADLSLIPKLKKINLLSREYVGDDESLPPCEGVGVDWWPVQGQGAYDEGVKDSQKGRHEESIDLNKLPY